MAVTRSACVAAKLPAGWKKIKAHTKYDTRNKTYYISPEGRRFESLKEVSAFIMENIGRNVKELSMKMGGRSKQMLEEMKRKEAAILFEIRSKEIRKKRKIKSKNHPLKNLLKNVLKRMHRLDPFKKYEKM